MKINIEFRGGILFVRLTGELTMKTINKFNKKVTFKVGEYGIRNIVFNLTKVSLIDYKGLNTLLYNYELSNKNEGRVFVCGLKDNIKSFLKKNHLFNYIYEIPSELCALNVLKG